MFNEKSLLEMCEYGKYDTDKFMDSKIGFVRSRQQNRHCYVEESYGKIFPRIRESAKQVLEIGVDFGGSLLLWRDYFPNAHITGVDISPCAAVENQDRIKMIVSDAYSESVINSFQDNAFDLIIDDGPHTLDTMTKFLRSYHTKLTSDGIMVLEDIPDKTWLKSLCESIPEHLITYTTIYDFSGKYGRSDDIFIIIDKGVLNNG